MHSLHAMFAANASPHIDARASANQDNGKPQLSDLANRRDQFSPRPQIGVNAYRSALRAIKVAVSQYSGGGTNAQLSPPTASQFRTNTDRDL
jgi:hypothetical protein